MIIAIAITGKSMNIVTGANVIDDSRETAALNAAALRKHNRFSNKKEERLIRPMAEAERHVKIPEIKPILHNNSMKGMVNSKGRAKTMGRIPKLQTASTEYRFLIPTHPSPKPQDFIQG